MGFTQQQATEAFMVCGKNEELAVNYLFDHASGFGDAAQVVENSGGTGTSNQSGIQMTTEEKAAIDRVLFSL